MARRRFQRGSLRKRGKTNPVWEAQWYEPCLNPDGTIGRKRRSVILGLVSDLGKKEAKKKLDELLLPLNQGKFVPHSTLTFRQFCEQFYAAGAYPSLKPSTARRYQRTLKTHLLPAFGDRRLCDLTTFDVQQLVNQKLEAGLSWEVCNHLRNLVSTIYTNAKKWRYFLGENPASGVQLPQKQAVREKHVLTPEQISKLFSILPEPIRTMVQVGILTGLRVGEILGLRWSDVDFEKRHLRIERAVYRGYIGSPKTQGSKRSLPIPECLLAALASHYRRSPNREGPQLVFQTRNGTPFNDTNLLHRLLKPAGKQVGAPWLSWHTLRRTHATLLQLAGGSLKDAQAQLGHSNPWITAGIYTQPLPAHQREAVENLARLVANGDESGKVAEGLPVLTQRIQ
jgi:integrase